MDALRKSIHVLLRLRGFRGGTCYDFMGIAVLRLTALEKSCMQYYWIVCAIPASRINRPGRLRRVKMNDPADPAAVVYRTRPAAVIANPDAVNLCTRKPLLVG
jgi:hypothetical protein